MSKFEEKIKRIDDISDDELLNKLKKASDKRKDFKETTEKKVSLIKFYLPMIFTALISLALLGLMELVTYDWSLEGLKRPNFWYNFITLQSAIVMISLSITYTMIKYYRNKDIKYADLTAKIQTHIDNDSKDPFIESGVYRLSIERKKNAWEKKIKTKEEKLRKKIKDHKFDKDDFILNGKFDSTSLKGIKNTFKRRRIKKNIKLKSKFENLSYMQTNKFFLYNSSNIKVKYNKLTFGIVTNGFYARGSNENDESVIVNRTRIIAKRYFPRIFMSLAVSMFFLSFIPSLKEFSVYSVVAILFKIIIVSYNAFMSWIDSYDFFQMTDIYELSMREKILNKLKKTQEKSVEKID